MRQTVLSFNRQPDYARDQFIVSASNAEALSWIEAWPEWPNRMLFLYGPAGSGKTHLAHIWAEKAGARFLSATSGGTSLEWLQNKPSAALENLEAFKDENALFHLINHLRDTGGSLLVTATIPASHLSIKLPDLASRLQGMAAVRLDAPDDALLSALLAKLFHDRQLRVGPDVIEYMLPRLERSFASLQQWVERLDAEALARHKNITIPFVRDMLENYGRPDPAQA